MQMNTLIFWWIIVNFALSIFAIASVVALALLFVAGRSDQQADEAFRVWSKKRHDKFEHKPTLANTIKRI